MSTTKKVSREEAASIIRKSGGKIFGATFTKKNGEKRIMNARLGVTSKLKGCKSTIAGKENLIGCYDNKNQGYRCINTETLQKVSFGGTVYEVEE